jgi:tRNA threonylcarbamoyladenosine biosynthesis protein TsaE
MRRWTTASESETEGVGRSLAAELSPDGVLLLDGDLGSGKTVLTKGIAAGLGIDPLQIQSPTFTIIREHEGSGGRLIHVDLYRLEPEQVAGIGLEEFLAGSGVKVVEWAERLDVPVAGALRLELRRSGNAKERIIAEIEGPGGS